MMAFLQDRWRIFLLSVLAGFAAVGIASQWMTPYDPYELQLRQAFAPPSAAHLLGTDQFGRDIASRTMLATTVSMKITMTAILAALIVGVPLGMLAGYVGGRVDAAAMRMTDLLLIFPPVLLAIVVVAVLGPNESGVILALGVYATPQFIRIARSSTLSVKQQLYVEASVALGASRARIIVLDIWPNISAPVIAQATLMLPVLVLSSSALSFLGLGVQPPTPEWGAMLSEARNFLRHAPHLVIGPGLALFAFVLSSSLLGDSIQGIIEPRTRDWGGTRVPTHTIPTSVGPNS
jgi:ABC-type dipeptide/oligopeptide/nickel transport system permease subunit